MHQPRQRHARVDPASDAGLGRVGRVSTAHWIAPPQPIRILVSDMNANVGTARFSGAGPSRMRPGGIVDRAMARAEPATVLAGLTERHAAEMRADADHHEPVFLALARRAVEVGRRRVGRQVGVARHRVLEFVEIGTFFAASISSGVRLRMKTGLPRHLTVSDIPGCNCATRRPRWRPAPAWRHRGASGR